MYFQMHSGLVRVPGILYGFYIIFLNVYTSRNVKLSIADVIKHKWELLFDE